MSIEIDSEGYVRSTTDNKIVSPPIPPPQVQVLCRPIQLADGSVVLYRRNENRVFCRFYGSDAYENAIGMCLLMEAST